MQVRRAVEMLVQSLDRADRDSHRTLFKGIPETEIYNAALTVMMRLVFLFCAEERRLFPLDDELYSRNYAVSTLQEQLRETADHNGEEILERRRDAWSRLLSIFRAVHGGIQHDRLNLPAYGGDLFNPDRYPFLEGRAEGTHWRDEPAKPLPVDNRTALHLLESLQILRVKVPGGGPAEPRRLSFRALDIEQIGHVYEGMLDHTAKRAEEPVVSLKGKEGDEPEIELSQLERLLAKSESEILQFLKQETGRSEKALKNDLEAQPDALRRDRLRSACDNDEALFKRALPLAQLVRDDSFGYPVVIPQGSLYVTQGTTRRSTGTHYTPRSLTESIVQHALEPILYPEMAEGKSKEKSCRLSFQEILDLKICDMAMGSGAFLVQTCRFLADAIMQQWAEAKLDAQAKGLELALTVPYADPASGRIGERLIPEQEEEQTILARRLVAEKCLYGVDKNPLAVEMAKLSLWLITMDKNRPFTFLDHAFKGGDSLLSTVDALQIDHVHIKPDESLQKSVQDFFWFSSDTAKQAFRIANDKRNQLESYIVNDSADQQRKESLLREADQATQFIRLVGDLTAGAAIACADGNAAKRKGAPPEEYLQERNLILDHIYNVLIHHDDPDYELNMKTLRRLAQELLLRRAPAEISSRHPFHWPVEFPEVFLRPNGGFDAIVGNPPFMGGQKITGELGTDYRNYLIDCLAAGKKGSADLCAYFFLRANSLLRNQGGFGLLATNTIAQGDTREVGLEQLAEQGCVIHRAIPSRKWPGEANLEVAHVWARKGLWKNQFVLDEKPQLGITAFLTKPGKASGKPYRLAANANKSFQGSIVLGMGFVLTPEEAQALIDKDSKNKDVLFPYLNGEDLNSRPDQSPNRWVINFFDWPLNRETAPEDWDSPVAADYPDCLAVVEEKVKPERMQYEPKNLWNISVKAKWWLFGAYRSNLHSTIAGMEKVLVRARVSRTHAIALLSGEIQSKVNLIIL
ncbi:MAG: DNA methyltransferase [Candidatus Omnitrophota bacterium]